MDRIDPAPKNKLKITLKNRNQNHQVNQATQANNYQANNQSTRGGNIKVNLVRKLKNSPILSIQNYIYQNLRNENQLSDLKSIWEKYQKLPLNSTIIKNHQIDYDSFRRIAEQILQTLEPYSINIDPVQIDQNQPKITNYDLIDLVL